MVGLPFASSVSWTFAAASGVATRQQAAVKAKAMSMLPEGIDLGFQFFRSPSTTPRKHKVFHEQFELFEIVVIGLKAGIGFWL